MPIRSMDGLVSGRAVEGCERSSARSAAVRRAALRKGVMHGRDREGYVLHAM